MVHLHSGGFMSIVEGQEEAEDTGGDTSSFVGFMLIVEDLREAGDTGGDTPSFW